MNGSIRGIMNDTDARREPLPGYIDVDADHLAKVDTLSEASLAARHRVYGFTGSCALSEHPGIGSELAAPRDEAVVSNDVLALLALIHHRPCGFGTSRAG